MGNRRNFIQKTFLGALALGASSKISFSKPLSFIGEQEKTIPIVISTWNHGLDANSAAWKILKSGGKALDAVEKV